MSGPPLKLIEWEDAFNGDHAWTSLDELEPSEPLLIQTVGFEIRRDKARVTLAMSHGASRSPETVCDLFTIPLAMIRSERKLK